MPTKEEINAIIAKHFPPPPQPSNAMDSEVEWERCQAWKVVVEVLTAVGILTDVLTPAVVNHEYEADMHFFDD